MSERSRFLLITIAVLFIGIYLSLSQLLYQPRPWSDEAIYHQMVTTHHKTGEFGIPMWKGLLLETETHNYWYPPFFFSVLSIFGRVVELDLASQRSLSVAFSVITVVVFMFFSKKYLRSKYYWLPVVAFLFDFIWLRGSRLSRPESLIFALGSLSLVSLHFYSNKRQTSFLITAGVLAALAQLSHYYGLWVILFGVLYLFFDKKSSRKLAILYGLASFSPLIVWWIQTYPDWQVLWNHTFLGVGNKVSIEPITLMWFKSQQIHLSLQMTLVQLLGIASALYAFKKRSDLRWMSAGLLVLWLMIFVGRMFWYVVYVIPFSYLLFAFVAFETKKILLRRIYVILSLVVVGLSFYIYQAESKFADQSGYDYESYSRTVAESVPEDSTVFLSAAPESYYGFVKYNPSVKLVMYPAVWTTESEYQAVLDQVDYVVFTGDYVDRIFGNFLPNYLENNVASYTSVTKVLNQEVTLIELVSKQERVSVN